MKRIILFFALLATHPIFAFYAGVGFAWNTIDETFKSNLITNENKSGQDRYTVHINRLSPMVKLGHQFFFCDEWTADFSLEWKYLNYQTPNENSSRGQILPNATFSSINIFGPEVLRDFTSQTHLNNELLLFSCLGRSFMNGYAYLGLGAAVFDVSNSIYVSSVHIPNGTGDHLISTSVKKHKMILGAAARIGYQYFFGPNYFINVSYSYLQTGRHRLNHSVNASILNGFNNPGSTTLFLKRSIEFAVQEFAFSMNWAF